MALRRKMNTYEILVVNGVRIRFHGRVDIAFLDRANLSIIRTDPNDPKKILSEKVIGAQEKPS